ncbi:cation transporter [Dietzia sp. HMSC21D01]|uniref:DMT family transporter n=1 Tax=Dietzia TaxID=37914 RepID=UPI0008A661DF|nr:MULTISPECIES: SMR family transporter [Dietzia]MCT2107435.1 SMR family transporter [Dietzia cinnamea]OFS14643.1 cation transporter [Dietzia sp. HMSC21D01]
MNKWLLLIGAILAEVVGTLSLRAMVDHSGWIVLVVLGYVSAFGLLGLTLRAGAPIGVAYGIWGASGVALVALFGAVLFGESLAFTQVIGIAVIIVGVVVVELGSHDAPTKPKAAVA